MTQPWLRQKEKTMQNLIPSYGELCQQIASIGHERDRAFLACLYITGGRVSEPIMATKRDFILMEHQDRQVLVITLHNRKVISPRRSKFKEIPIRLDEEEELGKIITDWISGKTDSLWGFRTPRRGRQICDKWLKINPHFLRHTRTTHLKSTFGYSDIAVQKMMGWRDLTMLATTYLHTGWREILDDRRY